jgi:predicted nuclease of predicted toxin-antitoxin system
MRFVVDDQLPIALARWTASQGTMAEHVADVGLTGRPDQEIWAFAEKVQAVIVTKDEDFARLGEVWKHTQAYAASQDRSAMAAHH